MILNASHRVVHFDDVLVVSILRFLAGRFIVVRIALKLLNRLRLGPRMPRKGKRCQNPPDYRQIQQDGGQFDRFTDKEPY